MRPTNHSILRAHPQGALAPSSESRWSDGTGNALEPQYYVAFFKLHGCVQNDVATDSRGEAAGGPKSVAPGALHTEEELRQPLRRVPLSRSGHLMLSCPARRSLILHGGLGIGQNDLLNDTWEYCIDEQRWIQLFCHSALGEMPPKAFGQCGALFGDGRFLFVHGGVMVPDQHGSEIDAFQLDIQKRTWSRIPLSEPLPSLWGSAAQTLTIPVFGEDEVCSSGGRGAVVVEAEGGETSLTTRHDTQPPPITTINTTHAANTTRRVPVPRSSEGTGMESADAAQSPASGSKGAAASKPHRFVEVVVVFGGMQDATAFNHTYYLYLTTPPPGGKQSYGKEDRRVVRKLRPLSPLIFPGRRRACSTVHDGIFLFIFGGRDTSNFYNDLWVLNGFTQQWVMVREETPSRCMREFFVRPYDVDPGRRAMAFVEHLLKATSVTQTPSSSQHSVERNSSAWQRTGAVMVNNGYDILIHGGFTFGSRGQVDTHNDVHVYNCLRHVWRLATVEVGCKMPRFPRDFFTPQPGGPMGVGEAQWEKVRAIVSTQQDGRTMAAMCADPVRPGYRFFLFGGRSEEDARGELYDVRVRAFHPDMGALPAACAAHFHRFAAAVGDAEEAAALEAAARALSDETRRADALPVVSCFRDEKAARRRHVTWGKRRLCEQAAEWVRAVTQEEPQLRRATDAMDIQKKDAEMMREWLDEAHRTGAAMRSKLDAAAPASLQAMLAWAPAFIHRG